MLTEFWSKLDKLVRTYPVVIDRPAGSTHPRYPDIIYPLDYGYLEGTTSGDGHGIDVWVGQAGRLPDRVVTAIITTNPPILNYSLPMAITLSNPPSEITQYNHAHHESMRRVLRWATANIAWRVFARIDQTHISGLENLPASGPAILMINHIAFIDPIVVLGNLPRNIVPLAKAEVYQVPIWGIFPKLWDVIPVHREELDRRAIERALEVLAAGEVILIAPEATRHPALGQAKEGIAYIAHKSGAPIVPVAIENTTGYPTLLGPWNAKQPGAYFQLGRPFRFKPMVGRLPRGRLRQMTDEAMYRLAALLPEQRRGHYADLTQATEETIELV